MYRDAADVEQGILRQGDIIRGVHVLGAINLTTVQYAITAAEPDIRKAPTWSVPTSPSIGDAMVLSHSCEISPDNKVKVTSIILAPLRDVHTATKPDKVQELIDSNFIEDGKDGSYLKYFYLEPHQDLEFQNGAIVDFSKCFSVRNKSYDILAKRKAIQLSGPAAQAMALKLALYFHRSQDTAA